MGFQGRPCSVLRLTFGGEVITPATRLVLSSETSTQANEVRSSQKTFYQVGAEGIRGAKASQTPVPASVDNPRS